MPLKRNKPIAAPFTIDLISDLNLQTADGFDWEGKATSLFCVVAGNLSNDLEVIKRTLTKLSTYYRGVFYIDGWLEHDNLAECSERISNIKQICTDISGVVYLHNHVIILNGVAFVGINGWFKTFDSELDSSLSEAYRNNDIQYLHRAIKTFQTNKEVQQIVVISNCIPSVFLTNKDPKLNMDSTVEPMLTMYADEKYKVKNWVFGCYQNTVDTVIDSRRYVNNPHIISGVYLPKQIAL